MLHGHFKIAPRLGHDVRASAVFLLLYLVLLIMVISGVILSAKQAGSLVHGRGQTH